MYIHHLGLLMASRHLTRCCVYMQKEAKLKAVNTVIAARQTVPKPTRLGSITQHANSKVFTIL